MGSAKFLASSRLGVLKKKLTPRRQAAKDRPLGLRFTKPTWHDRPGHDLPPPQRRKLPTSQSPLPAPQAHSFNIQHSTFTIPALRTRRTTAPIRHRWQTGRHHRQIPLQHYVGERNPLRCRGKFPSHLRCRFPSL